MYIKVYQTIFKATELTKSLIFSFIFLSNFELRVIEFGPISKILLSSRARFVEQ